ncbi:MAG: PTS sugar transporter subunit IIA [Thermofilum sp.]
MLSESLEIDLEKALGGRVLVGAVAENWEEAVRLAGKLLAADGIVEERYVEAMVQVTRELGPYAVIAPGVALPHARPEDGAKEVGLSIVTLREGVNFGSPNDPVYIVIGFVSGLVVFLIFMAIFLATGFAVIVPPMIMLFFPGGAAAVFGNRTGGWKGAVLAGAINGTFLAIGQAVTLPALTHAPELATLADSDWYIIIWLLKAILSLFAR